jgi:hypothetical protein
MPDSDAAAYEAANRRIAWIIVALGVSGGMALTILHGWREGAGFLLGATISYLSFWRWRKVVDALGTPSGRPRAASVWILRFLAMALLVYGIIRFLEVNLAAAVTGLLVSAAAVLIEIFYEFVLNRK